LERHHDPGHDAQAECDAEDAQPEGEQPVVDRLLQDQRAGLQVGEPCRQPDREGGEDDVERNGEAELDAR